MIFLAPAKVNLFLDITGLRPDGYHEIRTVFQTVSLYDRLILSKSPKGSPRIVFKVRARGEAAKLCPSDERNIVWKAADLFFKEFRIDGSCRIVLEKNIPIQAGLGGGSSDAAAALNGLARLFLKKKPKGMERALQKIAKACGADVPFLLQGGCAEASGIGEKIRRISPTPRFWAVVVKPPVGCPTKDVYQWLDESLGWKKGSPAKLSGPELTYRPKIHKITRQMGLRKPAKQWGSLLFNSFEAVVFQKHPQLAQTKQFLLDQGAFAACLSGSGSALFGLVSSKSEGLKIVRAFPPSSGKAWLVRSV